MAARFRWPWEEDDDSEVLDFSIFDNLFDESPDISPFYYEDPSGHTGGTEGTGLGPGGTDPRDEILSIFGGTGGYDFNLGPGGTDLRDEISSDFGGTGGGAFNLGPGGTDPRDEIPIGENSPGPNSPGPSKIWESIKGLGDKGQVGLAAILAALGALNKAPPTGGGVEERYVGPKKALARTVVDNPNIPGAKLVRYAAQGGIMHAYANGGKVAPAYADGKSLVMQDGGFVFTGRAAEAANRKYGGIKNLIPEAKMISAPGGPRDDLGATVIVGKRGNVTPARVSNDEAYVPPGYDTDELQALMKSLERRA